MEVHRNVVNVAGTHNVPGIVGLAAAAKIAKENLESNIEYETKLRDYADLTY